MLYVLQRCCTRSRDGLRAVVSLLMILSLGLANFGYPVWAPSVAKGEAYPCQFGRCGCRTLEQCRTSCCCHTKQEKVAWALERGIDPDRVAVLTAAEKMHFTGQTNVALVEKACCTARKAKSCCCSTSKSSACTAQKPTVGLTFVLAITAQKCSGTGVEWIQAGFVAAAPQPVSIVIAVPETLLDDAKFASYLSPASGHLLRPA